MLLLLPALATPPDILEARADVLCGGGDQLAFLLRTQGNRGSHYTDAWDLRLVRLQLPSLQFTTVLQAGQITTRLDEQAQHSWMPSSAPPVQTTLASWKLEGCQAHTGIRPFLWTVKDQQLTLALDGEQRVLPITWLDPRGTEWWSPTDASRNGTWAAPPVAELPEDGMEVLGLYDLGTSIAVHARWSLEMEHTDMIGVVPKASAARSYLLNNRALQLHRQRDANAMHGFQQALEADPTNATARYNLACAAAVAKDTDAAIAALRQLPADGLAKRIAKDTDFDGVRSQPAFTAFLTSLE